MVWKSFLQDLQRFGHAKCSLGRRGRRWSCSPRIKTGRLYGDPGAHSRPEGRGREYSHLESLKGSRMAGQLLRRQRSRAVWLCGTDTWMRTSGFLDPSSKILLLGSPGESSVGFPCTECRPRPYGSRVGTSAALPSRLAHKDEWSSAEQSHVDR